MYKFDETVYQKEIEKMLSFLPAIEESAKAARDHGFDKILVYGVGGTWLEWKSIIGCLSEKTDIPIEIINASDLVIKKSPNLDSRTLAITSSVSGDSPEILAATKIIKENGLKLLAFSQTQDTPLGKMCDYYVPLYYSYCEHLYVDFYTLMLALLDLSLYQEWKAALPSVYAELKKYYSIFDAPAKELVKKYHKAPYSLWVGSGPLWYCTEMLAMCFLEEMLWIRVRPVTSPNFFHGTIEMVEEGVPVFVVKSVDNYRPLDQRVEDFLRKYEVTDSAEIIDMQDYPIPGLSDNFKDIGAILVSCVYLLDRIPKYYEFFTGHALTFRRYYRKLNYYS